MKSPKDIHDLDDDVLILVGQFVQQWLRVEQVINRAFTLVFNLDRLKAACVTSNMIFSAKLNSLRAGVNLIENPTQEAVRGELDAAFREVELLNAYRNQILHNDLSGIFTHNGKLPMFKMSARGKVSSKIEFVGHQDLESAILRCRAVRPKVERLTDSYASAWNRFELSEIAPLDKYDRRFLGGLLNADG